MIDCNITFVNYLMKDELLRAIDSLLRDTQRCSYSVKIHVVDNSENRDGIREALAARFPTVEYMDPKGNIGFGKGNNIGFQKTPARYYFALNPDTVVTSGSRAIERLIAFMDTHPKIGAIGPKITHLDGSLQNSCYRFDLQSMLVKPIKHLRFDERFDWAKKAVRRLLMQDFDHMMTRPVDWVLGAALLVRHEAAEQVGWFDDRYFMYLEDCDWCRSLWGKNWPVYYVHDITIRHAHGRGSAKVPGVLAIFKNKLARIHFASWCKYLWKWRGKHRSYGEQSSESIG